MGLDNSDCAMTLSNQNDVTIFAETNFRNQHRRFGIKQADRRYHMYILGKTGMGKTTLMENMIVSDINKGHGIAVLDPHGDMADRILDCIPAHRTNDVIYFNPVDIEYPIAFNVLERVRPELRPVMVSGVLSVFKKLGSEFWGPRMEHVFRNALLSVVQFPGATLSTVKNILTDAAFREQIAKRLEDKTLREFWEVEFASFDKRQRTEAIWPILNRIGQFLTDPMMRNVVGQKQNRIRFREVIDRKQILIANLSKGRIGEDNMMLLGALLITKLQLAALSRADIPEYTRSDYFLFVDEAQNFLTESSASMLAEMRKYRLNLILANQHLDQLDEFSRKAVLGNTGTIISFRLGAPDAEILQREFFPILSKEHFLNLPKFHIYLRLVIDGIASEGFSATTLPSAASMSANATKIARVSRERYGMVSHGLNTR